MKQEIGISVVVTVYNKENSIKKCLDSILSNNIDNIEIIVVDDKGTDSSMNIVNDYAIKYPIIKIVTNETNMGCGYSRYIGIKNSTKEWISFIDADDYVSNDYFQNFVDYLKTDETCEFISCHVETVSKRRVVYSKYYDGKFHVFNSNEFLDKYDDYTLHFLNPALVKRELFNKIDYCKSRIMEDMPTALMLLALVDKYVRIPGKNYFYCLDNSGIAASFDYLKKNIFLYYNYMQSLNIIKKINNDKFKEFYNFINSKFQKDKQMFAYLNKIEVNIYADMIDEINRFFI